MDGGYGLIVKRDALQSFTSLAKKIEMSLAHIGLSVEWGELIAKYGNCSLEK